MGQQLQDKCKKQPLNMAYVDLTKNSEQAGPLAHSVQNWITRQIHQGAETDL